MTSLQPDTSKQLREDWKKRSLLAVLVLGLLIFGLLRQQAAQVEHFYGHTMGTTYQISYVPANDVHSIAYLQSQVEQTLDQLVDSMSTYENDSEISRFNASALGEWFALSHSMAEVVAEALLISEQSQGRFDPTVGPLVSAWGVQQAVGTFVFTPPDDSKIHAVLTEVGYEHLVLDAVGQKLKKRKGIHLDLSAIAKGYAVDRIAAQLQAFGVDSFLVEIGGEVYAQGLKPSGQSWRVAIEEPKPAERVVNHIIELEGRAIASSGDYRNYVSYQGKLYGHILDPTTGYPVPHQLYSVTVVHPSAMTADGWATAMSVLGPEEGLRLADELELAVLFLMDQDGQIEASWSQAFEPYRVFSES